MSNFVDNFIMQYKKEFFKDFYLSHTNSEVCKKFDITKRQLSEIKDTWQIEDKPTYNDIIKTLDIDLFKEDYKKLSNEELYIKYNINKNSLFSIRKKLKIPIRTKEEEKNINLRLYGVEFNSQREDTIVAIKKSKNITYSTYKEIIKQYTKEEIELYLKNHTTEECCIFFNTTYDNIKKVRKQLGIICKSQQDKEALNKRVFGVNNVFQLNSVKEKTKQTLQKKHGKNIINYGQTEEQKQKAYASKKKNNTFNTSKPEDKFYKFLVAKYGIADVFRQYYDKERYPFDCDFYIKSKDLFIELNFSWTHGGHPFNKTNSEDLKTLTLWEERSKNSDYYKNAIDVWTRRDLIKFEVAKNNNLNYKVFYNEEEAYLKLND